MKMLFPLTTFILAVLLVGCQDAPLPVSEPLGASLAEATIHVSTPAVFEQGFQTPEARREAALATHDASITFLRIVEGSDDWRPAHAKVLRELESASRTSAPYIHEQVAAIYMLRKLLASGDTNPEARDAVAYYTELLIGHRNPEGALIVQALQALNGHLNRSTINDMAARAVEGPENFLAKRRDCDECLAKRADTGQISLSYGQDVFFAEIERALAQLHQMSAG